MLFANNGAQTLLAMTWGAWPLEPGELGSSLYLFQCFKNVFRLKVSRGSQNSTLSLKELLLLTNVDVKPSGDLLGSCLAQPRGPAPFAHGGEGPAGGGSWEGPALQRQEGDRPPVPLAGKQPGSKVPPPGHSWKGVSCSSGLSRLSFPFPHSQEGCRYCPPGLAALKAGKTRIYSFEGRA